MKALVLSGGSGTRLRPFSYSMPKQLIPIANKPVLEHVLTSIRELGVTEIGIVVGDWAAQIIDTIGDGSRFGAKITYIQQDEPLGLAHCVLLARPFLGEDDFVLYLGDNVLPDGVLEISQQFQAERPAVQVVVHQVADPRAFGVVELDPKGTVLRLVEKPPEPRSDLALIGVYFFTAAIHRAVAAVAFSPRGELEITDAIQWLLSQGAEVKASEYAGYWRDAGRAEDVLQCNRRLLSDLRGELAGELDSNSRIEGEVVLEAGAKVLRSQLRGPLIIGAGTVIDGCRIGPNTAVGRNCVLRNIDLSDSIVLDGAWLSDIRGLQASIIGRHARVGIGTHIQHSLLIGDDAQIEIATG